MNRDRLLAVGIVAVAALGAVVGSVAASEPEGSDPYGRMVALLEAEISDEVVLSWAEGLGALPPPSAEQLIALKRAGAGEVLLEGVIALGRRTPVAAAALPAAAAGAGSPPATGSAGSGGALSAPAGGVSVGFRFTYQPRFDDGEEPWDLFVYLDGEPLARVSRAGLFGRDGEIEFRRSLRTGRHQLRIAQERHEHRFGRWSHQARVARQAFDFEVAPGADAAVELSFHQPWLGLGDAGPVSFRVVQAERDTGLDRAGGDPADWPLLCEEIESALDPDERPGREARRQLADCVRWTELWSGLDAPSRERVRDALARVDFQPRANGGGGEFRGEPGPSASLLSQ